MEILRPPSPAARYARGSGRRNPNPEARAMLTFKGTAKIDDSEATREKVYNEMPTQEQNSDKEKKGSAVVIDLDSVDGMYPGARVAMRK